MRGREPIALLVLIACGLFGCASAPPTPADWLPQPSEVPSDPRGGWIEIQMLPPQDDIAVNGELLAIENQHVYVWRGNHLLSVPVDSVYEARVVYYAANAGGLAAATVLGTLTTISNGALLIVTAPMWIIGGSIATNARARDPILDSSRHTWDEIVPYSRFPQGLPPDFEGRVAPPSTEPKLPAPEPAVARPRAGGWGSTQSGFCFGLGMMAYNETSGPGVILGFNIGKKWWTGGVRFSWGDLDYDPELPFDDTTALDLGVLLGVRGRYRALQAALRAGPAAWGFTIGDIAEFDPSLAVQGELVVYLGRNIGIGTLVAYNANDRVDFYTVTLGLAIGPR